MAWRDVVWRGKTWIGKSVLSTTAIITIILSSISASANAYRGIKTLQEAKTDIWGKVRKGVEKGLGDPGLITEEYNATWLQRSLNALGANPVLAVDGHYLDTSDNAVATRVEVKKFQARHNLTVDGWAGLKTLAALVEALKAQQDG